MYDKFEFDLFMRLFGSYQIPSTGKFSSAVRSIHTIVLQEHSVRERRRKRQRKQQERWERERWSIRLELSALNPISRETTVSAFF